MFLIMVYNEDSRKRRGRRQTTRRDYKRSRQSRETQTADTITGEHFIDGRTTEADGRRDDTVKGSTRERTRRARRKRTADDRQSAGLAILLCLIVNARTLTIRRALNSKSKKHGQRVSDRLSARKRGDCRESRARATRLVREYADTKKPVG